MSLRKIGSTMAMAIAVGFLIGGIVAGAIAANSDDIDAVRQSQIDACEESKDPGGIRYIVATDLLSTIAEDLRELRESKAIPDSFFPSIPPKVIDRLRREQGRQIRVQNHARRVNVAHLLGLDCERFVGHGDDEALSRSLGL